MKYFLILFIFLTFNLNAQYEFTKDKQKHFVVGNVIGSGVSVLMIKSNFKFNNLETILIPQIPMLFIGVGKETYDLYSYGNFNYVDILYNQIGSLTGSLIVYGINKIFKKKNNKLKL